MLDLHNQEARKVGRDPLLVEPVRFFLLNAVVSLDVEPLAVGGLQVGIGRRGSKIVEVIDKMIVKDHQREARVRMVVEALRYQNDGTYFHRASPELCKHRALSADVADVVGIGFWRDRGNRLGQCERDRRNAGLYCDLPWL